MGTPAVFNPTPATILEHPVCEKCGECLVCDDPHACPAVSNSAKDTNYTEKVTSNSAMDTY